MKKKIFDLNLQEEADKFRQNRDSAVDHERQLNIGLKEIEQVNPKKLHDLSNQFRFCFSYKPHCVKQRNMHNINAMNHQMNSSIY
jgi:hypothetical protein